jgi:hypothetical protein
MTALGWRPMGSLGFAIAMVVCGDANAQPAAALTEPETPYQDRVLADLPPDPPQAEEGAARNLSGWPRMVRVESRWRKGSNNDLARSGQTPYLYGLVETPNHGTFSVDGEIGPARGLGLLTLRQSDMPIANGWWASHEAGLIYTPAVPLSRKPSRVYVPSAFVRGVKGQWVQRRDELLAQASMGEPGWIDSLANSDFRGNGGRRVTAGLQWGALSGTPSGGSAWGTALQLESGQSLSMAPMGWAGDQQTRDRQNINSGFLAVRNESPQHRFQVNALRSQGNNERANANGLWLDSGWGTDRRQHNAGLYWLEPGLNWAGLPMTNDLAGIYARSAWQERQWSAEGSIDWLRSIEQPQRQGYYATGTARWRVDKLHQIGAGLSVRRYTGAGWSTFLDWRWKNPWGLSGIRWDQSKLDAQPREQQLTIDQDWQLIRGWSLASSFSLTRADRQTHVGAGLNLSMPVSTYASARASLNSAMSGANGRHLNLTLGMNWRLMRDWQLDTQYTRYSGDVAIRSLDPLAPPAPTLKLGNWSLYVVLRYEWQAGSAMAPLGGRPRDGGGRIDGTIYLDANRNGRQDADEMGAEGVQVILDNRFVVRTDAKGRYEFELVAPGTHTIAIRNESLPLPWGIVGDGQARVEVRLRESVTNDFPVQRAE